MTKHESKGTQRLTGREKKKLQIESTMVRMIDGLKRSSKSFRSTRRVFHCLMRQPHQMFKKNFYDVHPSSG